MQNKKVRTHASNPAAAKKRLMQLAQDQRYAEARTLGEQLCRMHPADAEAWFLLGAVHGQLGDFVQAETCCRAALTLFPDHAVLNFNMGVALIKQHKSDEAARYFQTALRLQPDHAEACAYLGLSLMQQGQLPQAIATLQHALKLNPDLYWVYPELSRMLLLAYDFDTLVQTLNQGLAKYPQSAQLHYSMGVALQEQGHAEAAESWFRHALQLDPGHTEAQASLAGVHGLRGEYEQAHALLSPLVDAGAEVPTVTIIFALFAHRFGREEDAVRLLQRQLTRSDLSEDICAKLHSSLGSIYDRREYHAEAFEHFHAGNALRSATFDRTAVERSFAALLECYSGARLAKLPRAQNHSDLPIFIVGMPRSGTSLVEQILASHPAVYGCGELDTINAMAMGLAQRLGVPQSYPYCVEQLDTGTLDAMAREYLGAITERSGDAIRITDKMPMNFLHLGLIEQMFPGARIIHCRRDPRDTCLSCYFTSFGCAHPYAYDLGNLGVYYRLYEQLMAHWRNVLRIPMLEIHYEQLVADVESHSRTLLEFCGLPWDERCLSFHENRRLVTTASHDQVRRPIYQKSVGRWKHYEAYLGPLLDALGMTPEPPA